MADRRADQLPAVTTLEPTDLLVIERDPAGAQLNYKVEAGIVAPYTVAPAAGGGVVVDTAALQAWIDALPDNSVGILRPDVYKSGNLVVRDKSNVTILRNGAKIEWVGTGTYDPPAYIGWCLAGTLTHVTFEGGWDQGDGDPDSNHAGFWTAEDAVLTDVRIVRPVVSDVVLGIQIGSSLSSTDDDCVIDNPWVQNIVGTNPGQGYGIEHAGGPGGKALTLINAYVERAQRHSVYDSVGSGFIADVIHIKDHRLGVATGVDAREAISAVRSQTLIIGTVILENCQDGGMRIEPDQFAVTQDIYAALVGQVIAHNCVPYAMWLGTQYPDEGYEPTKCIKVGSAIITKDADYADVEWIAVRLRSGFAIQIGDTQVRCDDNTAPAWAVEVETDGETAGTALYSGPYDIGRCQFTGTGGSSFFRGFYLGPKFVASAVVARFVDNQYQGPGHGAGPTQDAMFQGADLLSNPNVTIGGQDISGLNIAAGNAVKYQIGAVTHWSGPGVPDNALGSDGDHFASTDGGEYTKDGGTWQALAVAGGSSAWAAATLVNSWANYGGDYQTARYRKIGDIVYVEGHVAGGASATTVFNLPAGFRPPKNIWGTVDNGTGGVGSFNVFPGGDIVLQNGAGSITGFAALNAIQFSTT